MINCKPGAIAFLKGQRLGRRATISADGSPRVLPVGFRFNDNLGTIDISDQSLAKRKKYRDVQASLGVALMVNDVASLNPRRDRGLQVRGTAQMLVSGGETIIQGFDSEMFRIAAQRIGSWGLSLIAVCLRKEHACPPRPCT